MGWDAASIAGKRAVERPKRRMAAGGASIAWIAVRNPAYPAVAGVQVRGMLGVCGVALCALKMPAAVHEEAWRVQMPHRACCFHAQAALPSIALPSTTHLGVACTVVIFCRAPALRLRPLPPLAGPRPALPVQHLLRRCRLRRQARCRTSSPHRRRWRRSTPRSIASLPSTAARGRSVHRGRGSRPSASVARRWCTTTGMAAAGGRCRGVRPNTRCGWCVRPMPRRASWR